MDLDGRVEFLEFKLSWWTALKREHLLCLTQASVC